jgi:hypothetical protein
LLIFARHDAQERPDAIVIQSRTPHLYAKTMVGSAFAVKEISQAAVA